MAKTHYGGGLGFLDALTLLFIGLKLGHVIDWSWFWVLAPEISFTLILIVAAVAATID